MTNKMQATVKAIVIIVALLCGGSQTVRATLPDRPNIVLILADDLGYADLGCYGQQRILTPHLDQMAKEGMRFSQFYAGSTVCAPSRNCLMTGQHTGHTLIRGNSSGHNVSLRKEDTTIAELLHRAGYKTGICGKWGLGDPGTDGTPNRKGFDAWFGFLDQVEAHNYYPPYLYRNEEKTVLEGNSDGRKNDYAPNLFLSEALSFIERSKDSPFFLYYATTVPHANNELTRKTGNGMEVPTGAPYSREDWPSQEKNFAAMVTGLDGQVGQILQKLKLLNLDNKTIVFFTSDNGPHAEGGHDPMFFHSAGPLRGKKRDLTEGGIRVPMIARWPGKIAAGTKTEAVAASWDFLPTAIELAGGPAPAGIDGLSIVNALTGREQKPHEYLYWEFHERGPTQAVRMGDWKGIRRKGGKMELYDLKADIGERHNIADAHPEVVSRIDTIMRGVRSPSARWPM